jgi:hypothetical protein
MNTAIAFSGGRPLKMDAPTQLRKWNRDFGLPIALAIYHS